ncbi:hypothetical protein FB004_108198 [Sinorhizobium medicae]|nr:hypothetical protein FB004_108198 [Sinorhizobium medicae]
MQVQHRFQPDQSKWKQFYLTRAEGECFLGWRAVAQGTASRPSSKGRRADDRRRTAPAETCSEKVRHRAAGPRISFEISRPLLTLAEVRFLELHPFVGN